MNLVSFQSGCYDPRYSLGLEELKRLEPTIQQSLNEVYSGTFGEDYKTAGCVARAKDQGFHVEILKDGSAAFVINDLNTSVDLSEMYQSFKKLCEISVTDRLVVHTTKNFTDLDVKVLTFSVFGNGVVAKFLPLGPENNFTRILTRLENQGVIEDMQADDIQSFKRELSYEELKMLEPYIQAAIATSSEEIRTFLGEDAGILNSMEVIALNADLGAHIAIKGALTMGDADQYALLKEVCQRYLNDQLIVQDPTDETLVAIRDEMLTFTPYPGGMKVTALLLEGDISFSYLLTGLQKAFPNTST